MTLREIIEAYLGERGWRHEPPENCIDPLNGWWTRDEFKGYWKNPRTEEISDRFIDFDRAIYEQIEVEENPERVIWLGREA